MTSSAIETSPQLYARIAAGLYLGTIVAGSIAAAPIPGRVAANVVATLCYAGVSVLFYLIFRPVSPIKGKRCAIATVLMIAMLLGCTKSGAPSTPAATPKDGIAWRWHQSGYDLYDPAFSPDGTAIALVRQRHTPDGHEAEETPNARLEENRKKIAEDPRYADPEVIVLDRASGAANRVDWGWAPAFAPDGRTVAYSGQTEPISGYRILAQTTAGNDIRLYDRKTKTTTVLAAPEQEYFSAPVFSPDGRYVVFSLSGAVNGAHGGNIGIAQVDPATRATEILYPVAKDHDLYHLVDPKRFVAGRLLARRCRPTEPGVYLANYYDCDIIALGVSPQTIYSWGRRPLDDRGGLDFAAGPDGELLIHDVDWRPASSPPAPAMQRGDGEFGRGRLASPDGRLVVERDYTRVRIRPIADRDAKGRTWEFEGEVRQLVWTPDSRLAGVIVTQYPTEAEPSMFDELLLLEP